MQNHRRRLVAEAGVSLVEVLLGATMTVMVGLVVTSLIFASQASQTALRHQTDQYESLRLPSSLMLGDTRFAAGCSYDWDFLKLYTSTGVTNYIMYKFASWDGVTETPDPNHLHRWVVVGGVLQRDDIVGWNLVPPDSEDPAGGSEFMCEDWSRARKAVMRLLKAPLLGQQAGAHLETIAFMR